jgi:alpha-tubulin suppressor-like RCC1 family protein
MALKLDGTVWAWGLNSNGQLGDGTIISTSSTTCKCPVQVTDLNDVSGFLTGVSAISAGGSHSMALKSDGAVWAWGLNTYGRLGDGTTTQSLTPVKVLGEGGIGSLAGITAISAGGEHSMAIRSDGTIWAWGRNTNYELGDETISTVLPQYMQQGFQSSAISAGGTSSFAIAG